MKLFSKVRAMFGSKTNNIDLLFSLCICGFVESFYPEHLFSSSSPPPLPNLLDLSRGKLVNLAHAREQERYASVASSYISCRVEGRGFEGGEGSKREGMTCLRGAQIGRIREQVRESTTVEYFRGETYKARGIFLISWIIIAKMTY